jgi:predicted ATP-grasp superfamily ATP-dependent carboligase
MECSKMATKPQKKTKNAERLVMVPPESEPVLEELVKTFGTYKNVIGHALACLHKQTQSKHHQPANVAAGSQS